MADPLHIKYRPQKLTDMIGQHHVVTALTSVIKRKDTHTFLFFGPSGTGKTTLARITAKSLGCLEKDILEIDAATNTGIDSMRGVQDGLQYSPLGKGESKAIIVDECHMLSKSAWNSLLKSTEEPPDHVFWFFCTTEVGKVPATIKSRCASFPLRLVGDTNLGHLLYTVCEREPLKLPPEVGDVLVKEALGSPRQLLVNLALCRDVKDKKTAADILHAALSSDTTIALCQFLANRQRGSWAKVHSIINKFESESPESVRIIIQNYMAAALKKVTTDKDACHFLSIIEAFTTPYNPSEQWAPLLLSIGKVMYPGG